MAIGRPFVSEIAPNTYAINEFGLVAMYLVVGEEKALLIDTGCGLTDLDALVREYTDLPYEVALTHGHLDHVGGVGCFKKVYANERDYDMIRSLDFERLRDYCDQLGAMGGYDAYDYSRDMVKEFTEFPEFVNIDDGDVFDLGGRKLTVIAIPGHTKGGLAFLDEKNRILISGDCVNVNTLALDASVTAMLRGFLKVREIADKFDQNWNGHVGYAGQPTCLSQPKSVPEDLIHICRLVLEGKDTPTQRMFLGRPTWGMDYGHARLTYDRERLIDPGEEPVDLSLI